MLLVLLERDDTSDESSQTIKLRLLQEDAPSSLRKGEFTGQVLQAIILQKSGYCQSSKHVSIQVYDPERSEFRCLEHPDLIDCNLVGKYGPRLRVRISLLRQGNGKNLLAIQGRFYPYDGGLNINGVRLDVEEQQNQPDGGTAGNVWDGAIML
jgi:hypothetical protein